ncbi:MAG: hypothetical protein ACREBH_00030 [Candidatus Micrarchaeaceae archaeon]
MKLENDVFVVPGEKIATEEEFAAGSNTYIDNGVIYSSAIGRVLQDSGSVSVSAAGREIVLIGRDMLVIGVVTDDMKSVSFVKIDGMNIDRKDYLALKDGKILAPKPRMQHFGSRDMPSGRFENKFDGSRKSDKLCGVGDTILARVLYNDKDSYTLSLRDRETGVIYARCEDCAAAMEHSGEGLLTCTECGHREKRKVSELYGKTADIRKLFS